MTQSRSALVWLWLSATIIVLDLAIKYWADAVLPYGIAHPQLPVFDLTLLYNKGAAFSFLAGAGGWQRWFFAVIAIGVSIVLLIWLARTQRTQRWLGCSLALVLGGAIGNLYDRIVHGYVIDYISLHYDQYYFPAFNLADTAITVGAIMLIIDMLWFSEKEGSESESAETEKSE